MPQAELSTDSQKLEKLLENQTKLLTGFGNLQNQYNEIKADHEILREECKTLRDENKRLKQALLSMNNGAGRDFLTCETLLQEIVDLKETIALSQNELEEYKRMLEERNADLAAAVDALRLERVKKCNCFVCRFAQYFGMRKRCFS